MSVAAIALGLSFVFGLAPAIAADAHSSPEDRAHFLALTRKLEQTPLEPDGKADRGWAMSWLTDAPDVSVQICAPPLGDDFDKSNYPYAGEVVLQDIFAMGAFVIEHPDQAKDAAAQQTAGVEGALRAYQSILRDKPDAKSPALDALLQAQAHGELADFIKKNAATHCPAKK